MEDVWRFLFGSELAVVVTSTVVTLLMFGAACWGMGREERQRQKSRRARRPGRRRYAVGVAAAVVEGVMTVVYWFRDEFGLCLLCALLTVLVGGCTHVFGRRRQQ
ncbi:hypothetical protein ABZ517_05095 [Streptomyces scabiei]|uniref:hypothetical protein n=1 Tax=Streptomyces scabiei TaxID=1930 RepID=UPI0033F07AEE